MCDKILFNLWAVWWICLLLLAQLYLVTNQNRKNMKNMQYSGRVKYSGLSVTKTFLDSVGYWESAATQGFTRKWSSTQDRAGRYNPVHKLYSGVQ